MASSTRHPQSYSADYHPVSLRLPTLSPRPASPLSVTEPASTVTHSVPSLSSSITMPSTPDLVLRRCDAWSEDDDHSSSSRVCSFHRNEWDNEATLMETREDWETRSHPYHQYQQQFHHFHTSLKHHDLSSHKMLSYSQTPFEYPTLASMMRTSPIRHVRKVSEAKEAARLVSESSIDSYHEFVDDEDDDDSMFLDSSNASVIYWDDRVDFSSSTFFNDRSLESIPVHTVKERSNEEFRSISC